MMNAYFSMDILCVLHITDRGRSSTSEMLDEFGGFIAPSEAWLKQKNRKKRKREINFLNK